MLPLEKITCTVSIQRRVTWLYRGSCGTSPLPDIREGPMKQITLPKSGKLVPKLLTHALSSFLLGAAFDGVSHAQVLVVSPSCGTPGSIANITGSGWAE